MNLGEKIYELRTKQNLSQGDLADRMDLSRQSISKWENNTSVPDLENLIQLSEILNVSLDELVKGDDTSSHNPSSSVVQSQQPSARAISMQKVIGILLFCMAFLSFLFFTLSFDLLNGLIFSVPFLALGMIYMLSKEFAGLKCCWAVYIVVDLFLRLDSSINWSNTFLYPAIGIEYFLSWFMFLFLIVLVIITIRTYKKKTLCRDTTCKTKVILCWIFFVLVFVLYHLFYSEFVYNYIINHDLRGLINLWTFLGAILDYGRILLFLVAFLHTIRFRKTLKQ